MSNNIVVYTANLAYSVRKGISEINRVLDNWLENRRQAFLRECLGWV